MEKYLTRNDITLCVKDLRFEGSGYGILLYLIRANKNKEDDYQAVRVHQSFRLLLEQFMEE